MRNQNNEFEILSEIFINRVFVTSPGDEFEMLPAQTKGLSVSDVVNTINARAFDSVNVIELININKPYNDLITTTT